MKLKTSCPSCTASLSVEADLVGKHAKCPKCRTKFVIEEVRTPRSAQSVEQADAAVETVADGTTTAGAKRDGSAAAASGKTLGRFEIQGVLGQGGFGRVYKAYDPQLDRVLALKVPTFGPQDVQKAKRFQKEAKAAAQLRHPNIVPTFDSGKAGNQFFIATQFIEGEPLSKATELGPVEPRLAAEWCAKIADALAYAHEMGIVHRDVKPHNVMLDARSEPQLMDFGLAKRVNEDSTMTSEGSLLGTPAYMAPEQARGDTSSIGPHSDQYAVGAILYELLSGQRAFEGAPHVVLTQIVSQEPPGLRSINPAIPQDLEAIAQKAMSKEIDRRYESCEELAADLRAWLRGDPTTARPITQRERFTRWAKRNRGLAAAFGGTAVALLLAAGLGGTFAAYQTKARLEISAAQETTAEALTTAETERDNAQKERDAAQQERDRAETEKERAEKERLRAEEQTKLADTRLEASQANEYVANIRSAAAKWDAGDVDGANAALDAARPKDGDRDRRGWEWNYLWNLGHSEIMTIDTQSTTNGGGFVFFYPDNTTVFGGGGRIGAAWDSRTGDLKYQLAGEEYCFSGCCSADGRWLYTGNQNGEVTCWDAISGEKRYTIAAHSGQLKHATGKPYAAVTVVAVSGNGSRLVSYSYHDQDVKVWDTSTQEQVSALNRQNYQWDITTIALSVDGRVATMQGPLGHAAIWDTNTGQVLRQLPGNGQYLSGAVCRSPDLKLVVGAGTRGIVFWNAETGERVDHQLSRYQGNSDILWVQYSADGTQLLTAEFGAIKVWDCQTGQVVQEFKAPPGAYGSSADGRKLALRTGDGVIHIWDLVSGASPLSLKSDDPEVPVDNPMFTGKGDGVVTASGPGAASWDLASGAVIEQIRHPGERIETVWGVSFKTGEYSFGLRTRSPDRRSVTALGFAPGELYQPAKIAVIAWDSFTGKKFLQLIPQDSTALASNGNAVAFSPDGKLLATCWESPPVVKLWDTATGLEVKQIAVHKSAVDAVAFSRDGKRLVAGVRGKVLSMVVWNVETGQIVTWIVPGVEQQSSYVRQFKEVLFSDSGDRVLATITAPDGYKQLVMADAVLGQRVNFSQRAAVSCDVAQITPDGSRIIATSGATPSERGAIRVLDSSTGLELLAIPHERSPLAYGATARINPEGTLLVVGFEQRGQECVVLDGRPESEWKTRATERAARSTLAYFRGRTKSQDELVKAIQADTTINEDIRAMAVRFASLPPPKIVELQP